ncbi:MAG: UDP-3-O-(3-hydroxymyristoyl)glucosamine N-acyltransferase [Bacteroidales bacterium]|nr:UDP-3-O-(3-hydroxymyristoyl)glucosamine N-acyltransferase [Bacteroidales bacterium]
MEFSAQQIADFLQGKVEGNPNITVNNVSKIEEGAPSTLSFLANPKYTHYIYTTKSSIVLVNDDFIAERPINATLIKVKDAYKSIAMLLNLVAQATPKRSGTEQNVYIDNSVEVPAEHYIGAFAYISKGVKLGNNVSIYPQVYIGDNVKIGNNVTLYPGVKIYHNCVIGNNCTIHAGCVIGGDGFGFAPTETGYQKIAQIGNVVLEDNVEIGSNTTIDRATMGSTIIRQGVKLDNLIQIAHNVEIGKDTVIAAQTGIAGSSKVGERCMFGGQVGIAGHINIGSHVNIGAQSGIPNSVGDNHSLMGYPAVNGKDFARQVVYLKQLPDLNKEVKELKKQIELLKNNITK